MDVEREMLLSEFTKESQYFEVNGESMIDGTRRSILAGDILAVSELPNQDWIAEFKEGGVFVIENVMRGLFVKEVTGYNPTTGEITCHSWNTSPKYRDFSLLVDDIQRVFTINTVNRNLEKNPRFRE